jgi:hypothetical protein
VSRIGSPRVNHDGVLVVRGNAAVYGSIGPAVERDIARASGNNRLNVDDQSLRQYVLRGEIRVIGHRRRLMDRAPYAVAAKFFDDVKSAPAHFALDGAPDVFGAIPRPRGVERLPERAFGATRQFMRLACRRRHLDAHCRVRMVAVQLSREVELDQISGLDHALAGNAMHHFVVYTDAHLTGKPVNHWRRRARAVFRQHA